MHYSLNKIISLRKCNFLSACRCFSSASITLKRFLYNSIRRASLLKLSEILNLVEVETLQNIYMRFSANLEAIAFQFLR
jgi:hypothetical protein